MNPFKVLKSTIGKSLAVKSALKKNKNVIEKDGDKLLADVIYLHCISNGYITDYFSRSIQSKERYDLSGIETMFSPQTWEQKDHLLGELKKDGYCVLPERVSDERCDEIIKLASDLEFTPRSFKGKTFSKTKFEAPYLSATYNLGMEETLKQEVFQKFIADPFFLELATDYLKRPPILDPVQLWWSAPFEVKDDEFAQNYHFDMDALKWFKVFINFEDVTIENGPHSFMKGSHNAGSLSRKIRSKFYSRIADEEVYENFGKENEVVFVVPKGTILIEDTKGMHKGQHLQSGRRLLLSFQYSNSVFSKPAKPFDLPQQLDPNFKTLIERYPEFCSKFYRIL